MSTYLSPRGFAYGGLAHEALARSIRRRRWDLASTEPTESDRTVAVLTRRGNHRVSEPAGIEPALAGAVGGPLDRPVPEGGPEGACREAARLPRKPPNRPGRRMVKPPSGSSPRGT